MLPFMPHMHHVACIIVICWCLLVVQFFCVASGGENKFEDSVEYVQEDQEQFQFEDFTCKMIMTLTPFPALLCLVEPLP